MISYIIRRLLGFIPVLLGIALFTFVLVRVIPGGPFDTAGDRTLPPQVVANINAKYHLDWPMWKQFASYLVGDDILGEEGISRGVIRGDLGISTQYRGQPVSEIIADTFPTSAQLGIMSVALALLMGIPLGTIAALRQNSAVDYVATFSAVFFLSVPNLVLAPLLVWMFGLKWKLFPVAGWGAKPPFLFGFLPQLSDLNLDYFRYAALPVFALGIRPRGPSTFPRRPTDFIMSGVAMTASKSSHPPEILPTSSSPPTKSAPASSASFTFSPMARTRTLLVFPVPWGSTTVLRTCWSA